MRTPTTTGTVFATSRYYDFARPAESFISEDGMELTCLVAVNLVNCGWVRGESHERVCSSSSKSRRNSNMN